LGKFLLRTGRRRPSTITAWTPRHLQWVKTVHFEHAAQEATLQDYLHEVEHEFKSYAFQARSFNHSDISPSLESIIYGHD
jgi:hypothetical protein